MSLGLFFSAIRSQMASKTFITERNESVENPNIVSIVALFNSFACFPFIVHPLYFFYYYFPCGEIHFLQPPPGGTQVPQTCPILNHSPIFSEPICKNIFPTPVCVHRVNTVHSDVYVPFCVCLYEFVRLMFGSETAEQQFTASWACRKASSHSSCMMKDGETQKLLWHQHSPEKACFYILETRGADMWSMHLIQETQIQSAFVFQPVPMKREYFSGLILSLNFESMLMPGQSYACVLCLFVTRAWFMFWKQLV